MDLQLKEGMEYMKTWGGKLRLFQIEKVGPVVTEYSCWGKYKAQYVWVICLDKETPFLGGGFSYGAVKEDVENWKNREVQP